ncbi:hypothetical protein D210916BOD24_27300 [Alteromonas sp. D210916BOD_24]|uniref:hypothetical protein n=1 Tax=Alteromonas sp. D210916BOD_24 TaxID=3157618 RepID=UPI00399D002D
MKNNQQGAALITVIIVVLLLSLLITSAQKLLNNRIDIASDSKQQLLDKARVQSTLAELSYLIATQRLTPAGIATGQHPDGLMRIDENWASILTHDEIRVDGEYIKAQAQSSSPLEYAIQAENGLLPINDASHYWLKQWLVKRGLSDFDANKYSNLLHDYADEDDWALPSGAENLTYRHANLPPPSNFLLQSCGELLNVMEWPELLDDNPYLLDNCSLLRVPTLNVNAVPVSLWRVLWPDSADTIAQQRQQGHWLYSDSHVIGVEPSVSSGYYSFYASGYFTVEARTPFYSKTLRVKRQQRELPPIEVRH